MSPGTQSPEPEPRSGGGHNPEPVGQQRNPVEEVGPVFIVRLYRRPRHLGLRPRFSWPDRHGLGCIDLGRYRVRFGGARPVCNAKREQPASEHHRLWRIR